jgi:hypothetical protein
MVLFPGGFMIPREAVSLACVGVTMFLTQIQKQARLRVAVQSLQ